MSQETWTAVDDFFAARLGNADAALAETLANSAAEGLPAINVSPNQGKLLFLLAQIHGSRRILEIGTLGGYSTIWLARALPAGGTLVTLEADPKHAEVARANIARAGFSATVVLLLGPALDALPRLATDGGEPFDLIFIDADKPNTLEYFRWALRLSRPGSVIIADNVVRNGAVIDAESIDPNVQGMRRFTEALAIETRVSATAIQTVGAKGYDGFIIARVIRAA